MTLRPGEIWSEWRQKIDRSIRKFSTKGIKERSKNMSMKSISVLPALIVVKALVLTALYTAVQAAEATPAMKIEQDFKAGEIKKLDFQLAIQVESVLYRLKRKAISFSIWIKL